MAKQSFSKAYAAVSEAKGYPAQREALDRLMLAKVQSHGDVLATLTACREHPELHTSLLLKRAECWLACQQMAARAAA